MESSRDHLEAMVRQEEKFYQCGDYLEVDYQPEPVSPLHVIEQCSLLVTDVRSEPQPEIDSLRSPAQANEFPSPRTSFCDLPSFSEAKTASRPPIELAFLDSWRQQMLDWAFSVTETFSIDREIVEVAFSIVDRYLWIELERDQNFSVCREDFQLYCMVSMYIAIKALVPVRKLTVDTLIDMSQGFYSAEAIIFQEQQMLTTLDWHVHPPTVMDFCRTYMTLFPRSLSHEIEENCHFIAELSLGDVFFLSKASSLVALATILLVIQRCGVSVDDTHGFLENVRGLINIQSNEFDSIYRRLECLC